MLKEMTSYFEAIIPTTETDKSKNDYHYVIGSRALL